MANEIINWMETKIKTPLFLLQHNYYSKKGLLPSIFDSNDNQILSEVDSFWGNVTVTAPFFMTTRQSVNYIENRFSSYVLFKELSGLYGDHEKEIILDYGCGPGNDIIGFGLNSNARKIIGLDVSKKALLIAQNRTALHRIDPLRINLYHINDINSTIPLEDSSVDFINCQGVLHHTSHPETILKEFYRVLKPNGSVCIMVYNYNSIFLHLYTAFVKMILEGGFSGLSLTEAFSKSTDGKYCPISRCYKPEEFIKLCKDAGFEKVGFDGGYFSKRIELDLFEKFGQAAINDNRLGKEQKEFLKTIVFDEHHFPLYEGKFAGHGGVFHLKKNTNIL